ncbi:MAG TPA: hypothetical protein VGP25_03260 [Gemmatimonadaceae bacterium]|jgi:hypothetical protein|nr:hypothetical protein [Gemmatimonadaceae bacterium]
MYLWLLAALAGVAAGALQYGARAIQPRVAPLALLRALVAAIVVALLIGAPGGRATPLMPESALDASESWLRAAPACDGWRAALDSAARIGGARLRFGDSVRADGSTAAPTDRASRLRALADRAAGTGHPVVVITDGELEDAEALSTLPRGSRAIVLPCRAQPDLAVSALESPRSLLAGDTVTARATLVAGGAGAPGGLLELRLDDAVLATQSLDALPPYAERAVALRGIATGADRAAVLRAVIRVAGDREARNDTLSLGVDVSRAPAAVFVSSAPDFDSREAVAALRGVTSLPTRAYYRVAPGTWRSDGVLARVEESEVRAALRDAPVVVIHGDTSLFGPPRAATRGALLLFAPPSTDDGEWFAAAAPASPIAPALSALPFDSLPPLSVAPSMPRGEWQGLVARRAGAAGERRVVLTGWEVPRRVAILGASGFWRWRFRGGQRADAYGALFGTLFDWMAAGRSDRRAVVPDAGVLRAGSPIRWRRGAPADSVADVVLTRRGAPARVDSLRLRFAEGATVSESPPMPPGVYDVRVAGGTSVLVVNRSAEMIPRRPTVKSGGVGGRASLADAPLARDLGWLYAVAILALCAEWLLRRRVGLR